jgi:hypothetical protein
VGVLDLAGEHVHDDEHRHGLGVEADGRVDPQAVEGDTADLAPAGVDGAHRAAQPQRGAVRGVQPPASIVAVTFEVEVVRRRARCDIRHEHLPMESADDPTA